MTPRSTVSARALRGLRRPGGFALLIVVILLAFVVVMLVGLAAYTRIESSIAGNTQRQAQARQNALLGLNIALGQLQKYAGPDKRVTATAAAFSPTASTRNYTGVWASDPTDDPDGDPLTPLTWLASGNETANADGTAANPLAVTPASSLSATNDVALVSTNTSRTANDVLARRMPITATGLPGTAASATTTIGRYAWWVGDQGVKAPVATADNSAAVNYAPYGDGSTQNDLGRRLAQQIGAGPAATDANGNPVFEVRDSNNASLVAGEKILAQSQLAFLKNASNASLGLRTIQQNYHNWTTNNFAVLASTKSGGLRQDLSINPSLLGSAFAAWTDYASYTEDPNNAGTGSSSTSILPAYGSDPLRRRHALTPHLLDGNGSHQIGPVLTYFLISFNVRTVSGSTAVNAPLEVRVRWMLTLWNPYTAALVPEDLQIEVSGLPANVRIVNENPVRASPDVGSFSLDSADTFGSPLLLSLPWASAPIPSDAPAEDRQSWLPGRVYTWRSNENTSDGAPPSGGYDSTFYSRTLNSGGQGVVRSLGGLTVAKGDDECHLEVAGSANLRVTIYANRASGRVRLGGCVSPNFVTDFVTTPQAAYLNGHQFSYLFRLAESLDTPTDPGTWLTTDGRDPRRRTLPSESYVVGENGNDPANYGSSYNKISSPDRLLDRAAGTYSYNEDVPVFELPRGPLLSLGSAQHFRIVGRRPFMIGNSWGVGETLNSVPLGELFDRYFFSGLTSGLTPSTNSAGGVILPNLLLKPLRKSDGTKVTPDDLRNVAAIAPGTDADGNPTPGVPSTAQSSKFLLQGGAFNLNSTSPTAWAAVLRGIRFPAPRSFTYLDADSATGTAGDGTASVQSGEAQFFRFAQSAQETYKAESGFAGGDDSSVANTHLFRRGVRSLSAAEVTQLSTAITDAIRTRQAASGPFRSLEEFLTPAAAGTPSLLEQAIADAGINASIAEFSSQWLTQADVMTALAPYLFPRSDTFVVRAYGEAVNPATGATEGRAWCEATVQRLPEYFDRTGDAAEIAPADLTSDLNKTFGRRFRIVSFRWLTRSDI